MKQQNESGENSEFLPTTSDVNSLTITASDVKNGETITLTIRKEEEGFYVTHDTLCVSAVRTTTGLSRTEKRLKSSDTSSGNTPSISRHDWGTEE
jgi:hypothetical protein